MDEREGLIYEQLGKGTLKDKEGKVIGDYTVNTMPKPTTRHPAKKNGKKNGKKKKEWVKANTPKPKRFFVK